MAKPPTIPPYKTNNKALPNPTGGGLSPGWVIAFVFLFFMVCFSYRNIGAAGFNFFVWGDHILGTSNGSFPIIMWTVTGILFGAVVGSLVVWRKYHINFKWCLATIVPFLSLFILLQALSSPLQCIEPRPLTSAVDSALIKSADNRPVVPKRKKHRATKPKAADSITKAMPIQAISARQLAKTIDAQADSDNAVFTAVEISPAYPGGEEAFGKFLQQNIRYPPVAKENNIQGKVYLQFVVERDGRLTNMRIVRDPGSGLGEEAVRILKLSPNWKPGIQNGKLVRAQYTVPVNFSLGDQ